MVSAYEAAVKLLAEWSAQGLSARFPDDAGEAVSDGAAADGRTVVSGQHVQRLIGNTQAVVTWFEGGTPARITVFRQIAVNGRSPF